MKRYYLRVTAYGFLLIYCAFVVARIYTQANIFQWDFMMNYYAAKAYSKGLDPYNGKILNEMAKTSVHLYMYPPIMLWLFIPFTLLDYNGAFQLFLFLKCILLIGLIYFWRKEFLERDTDLLFYILCLFGYRSAIYLDFRAGSIHLFELFLEWIAFSYFLRKRMALFCALIVIAAFIKITPVLFLFLLWFTEDKRKHSYFYGSLAAFICVMAVFYISSPHLFEGCVQNALFIIGEEHGLVQPSTLALAKDVILALAGKVCAMEVQGIQWIAFFVIIVPVVALSMRAFITLRSCQFPDKDKIIIFLACVVYALVLPRFKDYYYVLLLVPTYFIVKRARHIKAYIPLIVLAILPSILSSETPLPGFGRLASLLGIFWEYYPLIIAYFVWGLYVYEIHMSARERIASAPPHERYNMLPG